MRPSHDGQTPENLTIQCSVAVVLAWTRRDIQHEKAYSKAITGISWNGNSKSVIIILLQAAHVAFFCPLALATGSPVDFSRDWYITVQTHVLHTGSALTD